MCKKFKFDHTNKWYIHNPASVPENDTQTPMELRRTDRSPNLGQKSKPNNNQQKKENLQNCRLCCPGWLQNKTEKMWKDGLVHQPSSGIEKTMEHERDNYTNFRTVTKGLSKRLGDLEFGGRVEIIRTTALVRTARIQRRVLETWGDLLSLKLQ